MVFCLGAVRVEVRRCCVRERRCLQLLFTAAVYDAALHYLPLRRTPIPAARWGGMLFAAPVYNGCFQWLFTTLTGWTRPPQILPQVLATGSAVKGSTPGGSGD